MSWTYIEEKDIYVAEMSDIEAFMEHNKMLPRSPRSRERVDVRSYLTERIHDPENEVTQWNGVLPDGSRIKVFND